MVVVVDVGRTGFGTFPSIYPVSPFDLSNCIMVMFHFSKFSPLNFCSSESIVNEGVPEDIVDRSNLSDRCKRSNSHSVSCQCKWSRFDSEV